jgi:hypothetical protein
MKVHTDFVWNVIYWTQLFRYGDCVEIRACIGQTFCVNSFFHETKKEPLLLGTTPMPLLLINWSPWSWALLEKRQLCNYLKNFPTFYGTWMFIIMYRRANHWSLSWARSAHTTPSYLRSILILSTSLLLCLPSGLISFGFPPKFYYKHYAWPTFVLHALSISSSFTWSF